MNQTDRFEKTAACPDNELLLAYRRNQASDFAAARIARHVQDCEFCLLTLELLAFHPAEPLAPPSPPPVPKSLSEKLRHFRVRPDRRSE